MFCNNAYFDLELLLDFVGTNTETCQPIFNYETKRIFFYLSLVTKISNSTEGNLRDTFSFVGKLKGNYTLACKSYKGAIKTPNGYLNGNFTFSFEPLTVLGLESFFGSCISGKFLAD